MEDASEERPKQNARGYQLEALQRAMEKNTIIFLQTGCGKTRIAVMLIDKLRHLIRKPSKKVAVFLVPTSALVRQQAKEIERHIEEPTTLKVLQVCGSMPMGEGYSNSLEWWQEQLVKYEVIVMTPQMLLNALYHAFLVLEVIELLVFDECHHAQKGHAYAHIMNRYHEKNEGLSKRDPCHEKKHGLPRILGLTASPIIGKGSDLQICKLESMLDASLCTVKDTIELETLLPNPIMLIRFFQPSFDRDVSEMLRGLLRKTLGTIKYFNSSESSGSFCNTTKMEKELKEVSRVHRQLDFCMSELGLWCTIKAAEILLSKEEEYSGAETTSRHIKEEFLREALSMLRAALPPRTELAAYLAREAIELCLEVSAELLSPKVVELVNVLHENREKYKKCIVFVEWKVLTTALSSLLHHLPFIRSLALVGTQSMSHNSQQEAVQKFRSEEVNLLVATSIAEEGLDIQSCSMVIRFDGPPKTTRSLIQSRGRARQKGSLFVVLLEAGNGKQLEDLKKLQATEELMLGFTENGGGMHVDKEPESSDVQPFVVESTGAMVSIDYSIPLLNRYCSSLPRDDFYQPAPEYSLSYLPGGLRYEISLPSSGPVQLVNGRVCQTLKMAKRVAALEACKRLYEVGALTDHLLPASEPDMNDDPVEDPKKSNLPEPHLSLVPDAFRGQWAGECKKARLFAYSLSIDAEGDTEYAKFALFLESDLDEIMLTREIELCEKRGKIVKIQLVPHGQFEFDAHQLKAAKNYQERIFRIMLDRNTDHLLLPTSTLWDPRCLYLTLPVAPSAGNPIAINWKGLQKAISPLLTFQADSNEFAGAKPDVLQMADGPARVEDVINSLVERNYGNLRGLFCVVEVLDMDANSDFCTPDYPTYVDYYKRQYGVDILHPRQPLLMVIHLMGVKKHFFQDAPKSEENVKKSPREWEFLEFVPELCSLKVRGFPIQMVNTVSLIPSLMHRIANFLIATQLKKQLEAAFPEAAKVSTRKVLQALTTRKCKESFDLERLEHLGDSFLKFAVSKRLFLENEKKDESYLSRMRKNVIRNKSLHRQGVARKLTLYIHDECFDPLLWNAPGRPCRSDCSAANCAEIQAGEVVAAAALKPNQLKCSKGHRWLAKKTVADVVEALIGAHLEEGGPDAALAFMEWVGIPVHFDRMLIKEASARCIGDVRLNQGKDVSKLEEILGYSFQNRAILMEAITHVSHRRAPYQYQRLEFLGDAVLDYLLTRHLYSTYQVLEPGGLTDLRSAAVSNDGFARVAVHHHLEGFLLHGSPELSDKVKKFVEDQDVPIDNPSRCNCYDEGPKPLADLVESLAGAVLLDSGFDIHTVWLVFERLLQPIVTPETLKLSSVRELGELCSKSKFEGPIWDKNPDKRIKNVKCTVIIEEVTFVTDAEMNRKQTGRRVAACKMLQKLKPFKENNHMGSPRGEGHVNGSGKLGKNSMEKICEDVDEFPLPSESSSSSEELDESKCSTKEPQKIPHTRMYVSSHNRSGQEVDPVVQLVSNSVATLQSSQNINSGKEGDRTDSKAPREFDGLIKGKKKIITPGYVLPRREFPQESYGSTTSNINCSQHKVSENGSFDFPKVGSEMKKLIHAFADHPANQVCSTPCNAETQFPEVVTSRAKDLPSFNPEHKSPTPHEESSPFSNFKGEYSDENLGRPRANLNELCQKYNWMKLSYDPCPGFLQGSHHLPRFAYMVSLTCCLMNKGQVRKYEIEVYGKPKETVKRAKDSAASSAMRCLNDCGLEFAHLR